jgi:hypothetical protein
MNTPYGSSDAFLPFCSSVSSHVRSVSFSIQHFLVLLQSVQQVWSLRSETLAGVRVKCPSLSSGCHQKCLPSTKFNTFPSSSCRVLISVHVDRYDVATGRIICSFPLASAPKGLMCGVQFWYQIPATCSKRLLLQERPMHAFGSSRLKSLSNYWLPWSYG